MPRDYFAIDRITPLKDVAVGGRIHVIGVCGVAMAQLALELARRGYQVSGSDKEFYEPFGSILARSSVVLCRGYAASNVPDDAALVVIGNAVSYGHPEVAVVEERMLPYSIFPQLLYETVIEGRHSVVISGTHGKTTTTALAAHVMSELNLNPSFFIGGAAPDLGASYRSGAGAWSVVEGDEYDSAFFAKVPKFRFYAPRTWVITSLEYDHADIYPSLDAVVEAFDRQAELLQSDCMILANDDFPALKSALLRWRARVPCTIESYGVDRSGFGRLIEVREQGDRSEVVVEVGGVRHAIELRLPGIHNAKNALAVLCIASMHGLPLDRVRDALATFRGVRRRQEIRLASPRVTVIDDFAHHPTAVAETVAAIRARFPKRRLIAVFEPRSNTSRRKVFQAEYVRAFRFADRVILCDVAARSNDAGLELLDVSHLAQEIDQSGSAAVALPDAATIATEICATHQAGDVILVMSNGSFGGLVDTLVQRLDS